MATTYYMNKHSEKLAENADMMIKSRKQQDEAVETEQPTSNQQKAVSRSKKPQEKRTRRFSIITYMCIDCLQAFLNSAQWVQHWAYITHDKDITEDGEPKEVHTHVILYTFDAKVSSAIKKNFDNFSADWYALHGGEAQNTLVQACHDAIAQYRYLTHKDDTDKYQYDERDISLDDFDYWQKLSSSDGMTDGADNLGLSMINDVLAGTATYTMIERYGKEYIYHAKYIKDAISDIYRENYVTHCTASPLCRENLLQLRELSSELFSYNNAPLQSEQINTYFNVLDYVIQYLNYSQILND